MTDAANFLRDSAKADALTSATVAPKAKSKGGNITANVNQAATELVTQSAKDGLEAGRKANDAFALAFAQTRKAGTAKMLESVESANEATASAVAAVDVDSTVEEALAGADPFSAGSLSLLG